MNKLTYNILGIIIKLLPLKDIMKMSLVCKKFYELINQDYIWRNLCLMSWPFVHHRFKETWKDAYKRKFFSGKHIKSGRNDEYLMIPMRAHKNYITALITIDEGIISGDDNGELIQWIEDDTKYDNYDEDDIPESFTPIKIWNAYHKIKEIIAHSTKNFISVLADPNLVGVFNFIPKERQIKHAKTIISPESTITYIGVYEDNLLSFTFSSPNIYMYDCNTGECVQQILYKNPTIITGNHWSSIHRMGITPEPIEKYLFCFWNNYMFICFNKRNGCSIQQFIDQYNFDTKKTVGTIDIPLECIAVTISNDYLFVFTTNLLLVYNPNILKCINTYGISNIFYDRVQIGLWNSIYTIYFINTGYLQGFNASIKSFKLTINNESLSEINLEYKSKEGSKDIINCIHGFENKLAIASSNMTIGIWDLKIGKHLYKLSGGSMAVKPKSFVDNPNIRGVSIAKMSEGRIVCAIGNLIRAYVFDVVMYA